MKEDAGRLDLGRGLVITEDDRSGFGIRADCGFCSVFLSNGQTMVILIDTS